jgi:hypothetical protein
MKKLLLLFSLLLVFTSCDDDDDVNPDSRVFMTFDPRFEGEDLTLGEEHTNVHNYPFAITEVKFYVSNLKLHHENGSTVDVSEIELIDILENKRTLEYVVPNGRYVGVSFGLGVPRQMNGTNDPDFMISQYPSGHPLNEQTSGMYWQWSSGYRFFSYEGRYSTDPQSTVVNDPFAFHIGTDTLYRQLDVFEKTVSLDGGGSAVYSFAIDVDSLFSTSLGEVDLAQVNAYHGSPSQLEDGIKVANNVARSIVLK